MQPSTARALDRLLRKMERPRRRRGLSRAPIYLALGLVLGYQLLIRFVPMVLGRLLPGGLAQAAHLRGWPGLLWRLSALAFRLRWETLALILGGATLVGLALCRWSWPLRVLFWLAAALVVLLDATIVILTIQTALRFSTGIGMG